MFTILSQAPTYFTFIHGWNVDVIGVLLGMPHLLGVGLSMLILYYGDFFLLSLENIRRLVTIVCKLNFLNEIELNCLIF